MAPSPIKVLQIGAGSMGTRRLRDLSRRPDVSLALYDEREDRLARAKGRFGVETFATLADALAWGPRAMVISSPPDQHQSYVDLALERGIHHFCEAHIWTPDFQRIEAAISRQAVLVCASSCSMHYLPVVRKLKEIVRDRLGTIHVYQMMLSVWLPSWHPWEAKQFYAWRRGTAAAREMVPFELLYLNDIFGAAVRVAGSVSRRGQLELDSEDTWCLQMDLQGGAHGQLTVLMGSPVLARFGCCFGSEGSMNFDIYSGEIVVRIGDNASERFECAALKDVIETAYFEEIDTFINAILGRAQWPHPYRSSSVATATLAAAEASAITGRWEVVDPTVQPHPEFRSEIKL
jgi:predicted dehydrogenase